MRKRSLAAFILMAAPAMAQTPVEYGQAVAARMRGMRDPVVGAYGLARVAALTCAHDRAAGAGLFQETARRLDTIGGRAFIDPRDPLPVASFTALHKLARGVAVQCDPGLGGEFDNDRALSRIRDERRQANDMLDRAASVLEDSPGRATQLAQGAMGASDPVSLDVADLTLLLSKLRDRAADLADELYGDALDFVVTARDPSPAALMELAKYVFVSRDLWKEPDREQRSDTHQVGGAVIVDLTLVRKSASPDDAAAFAEAVVKVVQATDSRNYNATVAAALVRQMLRHPEAGRETQDALRQAYGQLASRGDSSAAQIDAALGLPAPNLADTSTVVYEGIAGVFAAVAQKRFPEARQAAKYVQNAATRGQAVAAVDFLEAADAIARRDIGWANTLANGLEAGVKRILLYAGIAAVSPDREGAFGVIQLALRDIAELPSEHRMFTLAACGSAVIKVDPDTALAILGQYITAANDAYAQPWRGRRGTLQYFAGVPLRAVTLFNRRGLAEVIAAPAGRHRYVLRVPGAAAFTLPEFLRAAKALDHARLEGAVLSLKGETQLADGLIALAELRLR